VNKLILKYLVSCLILSLSITCGETGGRVDEQDNAVKDIVVAYYSFPLPSKGRPGSMDEKRIIHWNNKAQVHMLKLGVFTTPTTFTILPAANHNTVDYNRPLIEEKFEKGEEVILDISELKEGFYDMNFTAIGEGCRFEFSIE